MLCILSLEVISTDYCVRPSVRNGIELVSNGSFAVIIAHIILIIKIIIMIMIITFIIIIIFVILLLLLL